MPRKDRFATSVLILCRYYQMMYDADDGHCYLPARQILKIILAESNGVRIDSVPGDELEHVYELQRHCNRLEALLQILTANPELVRAGCNEALRQLFYLVELQNLPGATLLETLIPIREAECWATMTSSNC